MLWALCAVLKNLLKLKFTFLITRWRLGIASKGNFHKTVHVLKNESNK